MDEVSKLLVLAEIAKLSQRFDELGKRMDARFAKWEQQPASPSAPTPSPSPTTTTASSPAAAASTTTCEDSLSCSGSEGTTAQPFSVEKVVTSTTPTRCSTVCRSADARELVPISTTNNSPTRLLPAPEVLVEQFAKGVDFHEFIDGGPATSRPRRAPPCPPRPRCPRRHHLRVPRLRRPRRAPPRAPRPRRSRRASLRVLRLRRPRRAPPQPPRPRRPRHTPLRPIRLRCPRGRPQRPPWHAPPRLPWCRRSRRANPDPPRLDDLSALILAGVVPTTISTLKPVSAGNVEQQIDDVSKLKPVSTAISSTLSPAVLPAEKGTPTNLPTRYISINSVASLSGVPLHCASEIHKDSEVLLEEMASHISVLWEPWVAQCVVLWMSACCVYCEAGSTIVQWRIVMRPLQFLQFNYYMVDYHGAILHAVIPSTLIGHQICGNNQPRSKFSVMLQSWSMLRDAQFLMHVGLAVLALTISSVLSRQHPGGHMSCAILPFSSLDIQWTTMQVMMRLYPMLIAEFLFRSSRFLLTALIVVTIKYLQASSSILWLSTALFTDKEENQGKTRLLAWIVATPVITQNIMLSLIREGICHCAEFNSSNKSCSSEVVVHIGTKIQVPSDWFNLCNDGQLFLVIALNTTNSIAVLFLMNSSQWCPVWCYPGPIWKPPWPAQILQHIITLLELTVQWCFSLLMLLSTWLPSEVLHLTSWDPGGDPFFLDGCKFLLNCFLWHFLVTGFQVMQFYHGLLSVAYITTDWAMEFWLGRWFWELFQHLSAPDMKQKFDVVCFDNKSWDSFQYPFLLWGEVVNWNPSNGIISCLQPTVSNRVQTQSAPVWTASRTVGQNKLDICIQSTVKIQKELIMFINFWRFSLCIIHFYHQVVDDP